MNLKKDDDVRKLGKAFATISFVLWGVFPMLVLGWLVAAIARHPEAEKAIQGEPVYSLLLWWKGGTDSMVPVFLLIIFMVALMGLSYVFRKYGYSHAHDGMSKGRSFVQRLLIPSFLSSTAFATGIISHASVNGLVASAAILIGFGLFSVIILYIIDITKRVQ
jgi:hypothetical protein